MDYDEIEPIAYFKYQGKLVEDGYLDAIKAADALIGIDTVLRYFICQELPNLTNKDFEIPIRVKKGSWMTLISDLDWIAIGKVLGTVYASSAIKKMADNDFKNASFKRIVPDAIKSICWVLKLSCHLKTIKKKTIKPTSFVNKNEDVIIINSKGEKLQVPVKYIDAYINCPDALFSKISEHIEKERELEVSLNDSTKTKANITFENKDIFYSKQEVEEEEIVLPELKHGEYVTIEGHVTRGNENSNTIGFQYMKHILTCSPFEESIVSYKINLFDNCIMKGIVNRHDKFGNFLYKRPRIIFNELFKSSSKIIQTSLFSEKDF